MAPRIVRSARTIRDALGVSLASTGFFVLAIITTGAAPAAVAACVGIWLLLTSRVWRVGIRVEEGGVKVVGFLTSRRFAWDAIDHFGVGPFVGYRHVAHVVLRDGRNIGCIAIAANSEQHRSEVQRPIDELNAALAAWRQSEPVSRTR
jgi:hypothetical protein